jgi:hypothetical protein
MTSLSSSRRHYYKYLLSGAAEQMSRKPEFAPARRDKHKILGKVIDK